MHATRRFLFFSLIPLFTLAACGGGGSNGGGSDGGDQKPDPVVVDLPVAYVKRLIPVDDDGNPVYPDLLNPAAFNPGAELIVKARAAGTAAEANITPEICFSDDENPTLSQCDLKDLATSEDGKKLLFSLREPEIEDADEDEQPTWNIWEYDLETKVARRVITSNLFAEQGDDVSSMYLKDGSILFVSNRQTATREILFNEGKPAYQSVTETNNNLATFLLHWMKADGTSIQQISFNLSHDFQPLLLQNGRILFSRWDGQRGPNGREHISLYTANPDGTDMQYFFGRNSLNPPVTENTGMGRLRFFDPQELPDGRIAAIYMANRTSWGGDMVFVDPRDTTEAEPQSISPLPIVLDPELISIHGHFASLSPLFDGTNRLLVSWSSCRLVETANQRLKPCTTGLVIDGEPAEGHEAAPPLYGIWIYDLTANTQLPVVPPQEGYMFTEAVALNSLVVKPDYIPPVIDQALADEKVGLIHIRSVYDLDGEFNRLGATPSTLTYDQLVARPAEQRPARFLRILKAIPRPDADTLDEQDDNIYGELMANRLAASREIIGYVPIEPDGSVQTKVPADVAFSFEVLDKDGRRIQTRHTAWLTLRPGEVRTCHGCHDARNTDVIHGREGFEPEPLNGGAPASLQRYDSLAGVLNPDGTETMAEFAARSTYCSVPGDVSTCLPMAEPGVRNLVTPSVDLIYQDFWTTTGTPAPEIRLIYDQMVSPEFAPVNEGCRMSWSPGCRIVINYEYHIQPLWEVDRGLQTIDGYSGSSCLGCHSGDDNGVVPAASLYLDRAKANNNQPMRSYIQLTRGRDQTAVFPFCEWEDENEDENEDIPACIMPTATNDNGDLICSEFNPCPFVENDVTDINGILQTILAIDTTTGLPIPANIPNAETLGPVVGNGANANASRNFFNRFGPGGSHDNLLNEHERRLISEWLDLNRNYYNNPFELSIQQ